MTNADDAASSLERLHRMERAGRILLLLCFAILMADAVYEAYISPLNLRHVLRDWPAHVLVALTIGVAGAFVPFSALRRRSGLRIAGVVAVFGTVAWLGFMIALLAVYAVVMSGFD